MDRKTRFRPTFGAWWRAMLTLLLITLAGLIIPHTKVKASLWPVAGAHEATNVASAPNVPALAPQMAPESAATLIKNSQSNDMPGLFQAGQPHNPALAQAAIASAKQSLAHSADNGPAELNWRASYATPSARHDHAMAYDNVRGVVVLFGGRYYDGSYHNYNDTWEWDGQNWVERTPTTTPSVRYRHAMAYDSARGVVVLFGGDGGSSYNDTWEWDGQNWVERTPTTAPLARFGDAMAYDSARGVVVLFGGYRDGRLNDTWEYGPIVTAGDVVISEVRVSNVRNVSFTVSWLTNAATSGHIRYGSEPKNLNLMADDRRGASTSDETHYVRIDGLSANTTYYFDVLSGDVTDHNDGQNYMLTTGPTLDPPGMDTIYGQVLLADGVTPAEGTIVHVTLEDNDGVPSHGVAAPLSDLVDEDGFWNINLAGARLEDLSGYFYYTPSGDRLKVEAQAGTPGSGCQIVDTANDTPAVSIVLQSSDCTISLSMNILPSWNYIALPVELAEPTKAEDVCDDIDRQGGKTLEIDNWEAGGWHGHICDLPFENFTLAMGAGYFIKATEYSTWSIEGEPVTTPVPLELQEGWNSIAIPHTNAYTAESLCDELISQSVTAVEIDRWYHSGWNGHICGESFNNFEIQPGEAYFVKTTSSGTVIPDEPTVIRQPDPSTSGTEVAPVSPDDIPVGKAMPVRNLRISNLRDTSVTLSWSTDQATTGYVRFAEPADLMPRRAAYDTRGATSSSKTHIVVLDHLTPETTYQIEIVSGGGTTKTIKTISVTTASILERIPQPDTIYGQVFYADGITPATGTIVYLSNRNLGNRKGLPLQDVPHREPGNAILLSALVDSDGYWHANLGNARQIDTADEHTTLLIQAAGHSKTVDIGSLRPAPPLILSPQTRLYLPLITHEDALK